VSLWFSYSLRYCAVSRYEVGTITDRGLSPKRPINEDRYLAIPEKGLFAVADGVGGELAGEVASQTVVDELSESMNKYDNNGDIEDFLEFTLQRANQQIYRAAKTNQELSGMASTVALVFIEDRHATIAHLGDSRVYSLSGGRLKRETHDHTDVEDALRSGRITEMEAQNLSVRNVINRAVGVEPEAEPEFSRIDISKVDALLLCTDGITRHIPDRELEDVLRSNLTPQQMCDELKWRCHCRGAEDNLTAVIVRPAGEEEEERTIPPSDSRKQTDRKTSRIQVRVQGALEKEQMNGSDRRTISEPGARAGETRSRSVFSTALKMLLGALLLVGAFYGGIYVAQHYLPSNQPVRVVENIESSLGAKDYLREGTETDPEFQNALQLFDNKEYIASRDRFQNLTERTADNARYHYWFGRASFEAGDYNNSLKGFQKAAGLNLKAPTIYLYEALSYQALGKEKEAAQSFKRFAVEMKR
jgi:PPM family protein phosphatase